MKYSILVASVVIASAGTSSADDQIVLHFYERPPYMVKKSDGGGEGLTADAARATFEKAGIEFRWALTPAKRQLKMIEANEGLDCGVGWYQNAERNAIGKFTQPIYHDKPTVVITRSDFKPAGNTLKELLSNPKYSVIMKDGLTYGKYVFEQVEKAKASVRTVVGEQSSIARMISASHADFMFSPQEEADTLIASTTGPQRLKILLFPDIKNGDTRHIFCSKKVGEATIAKLNMALEQPAKGKTQK